MYIVWCSTGTYFLNMACEGLQNLDLWFLLSLSYILCQISWRIFYKMYMKLQFDRCFVLASWNVTLLSVLLPFCYLICYSPNFHSWHVGLNTLQEEIIRIIRNFLFATFEFNFWAKVPISYLCLSFPFENNHSSNGISFDL